WSRSSPTVPIPISWRTSYAGGPCVREPVRRFAIRESIRRTSVESSSVTGGEPNGEERRIAYRWFYHAIDATPPADGGSRRPRLRRGRLHARISRPAGPDRAREQSRNRGFAPNERDGAPVDRSGVVPAAA